MENFQPKPKVFLNDCLRFSLLLLLRKAKTQTCIWSVELDISSLLVNFKILLQYINSEIRSRLAIMCIGKCGKNLNYLIALYLKGMSKTLWFVLLNRVLKLPNHIYINAINNNSFLISFSTGFVYRICVCKFTPFTSDLKVSPVRILIYHRRYIDKMRTRGLGSQIDHVPENQKL